jgi:mono/diheme cytochrome c family protein
LFEPLIHRGFDVFILFTKRYILGAESMSEIGIQNISARLKVFILLLCCWIPVAYGQGSGDVGQYRDLLNQYCVSCHNEQLQTAGLMLDVANIVDVSEDPDIWERVITKLSLRAMPPVGHPIRPDENQYTALLNYLQTELGQYAIAQPNPGRPTVHRLNRTEYANAIRDLLAMEIDAAALLPPDNLGEGFDTMAEVLSVSPLLMERYMFAAGRVSRLAVGPATMQPASEQYTVPEEYRQNTQMSEELPFGSRGGTAIKHYFPQDGQYTIKIDLERNIEGYIRGLRKEHTIDVRVDHQRVATFKVGGKFFGRSGPIFTENQVVHYSGDTEQVGYEFTADEDLVISIPAKAGTHLVGVSFVDKSTKATGINQPDLPLADIASYKGGEPEVASVTITGPFNAQGPGEIPSRKKIFVCSPSSEDDLACAKNILSRMARLAYRRPVSEGEVDELLRLFRTGQQDGGFDSGIELALQSILAGPEFLFRIEKDPPGLPAGDVYPVGNLELASRLSFFLWSSIPDDDLLSIAEQGKLRDPSVLQAQVQRMMQDPRSHEFIYNFGSQWLGVRNIDVSAPNPEIFPEFDEELRQAFIQELMLWFESMVRQDESILEVLTSDYTYVNERLARHYGVPDIYGSRFRPIKLAALDERRGLFGKGGILMGTAFNNRTSPVVRGKWVLENLLNMPPPPPPDNVVPTLSLEDESGKAFTLKQAMEAHRANPVCAACHKLMDPIGFALENYDAVGSFRARYVEADTEVDSSGTLFDGSAFADTEGFKNEFLEHKQRFANTVTQKIMTYALGRSLEYYDQPAVREIVEKIAQDDYRWSSLLLGIIESTPFQYRRVLNHDDI